MSNYNFEKWWKLDGRLLDIITENLKDEDKYKKFAEKVWLEATGEEDCEKQDCSCGRWD